MKNKEFLTFYVCYNSPRDYPDYYVVRPQYVKGRGAPIGKGKIVCITKDPFEISQTFLLMGLTFLPRDPKDDLSIMGSWL